MGEQMRSLISVAVVVLSLAAPAWVLGDSSEAQAADAAGVLYPLLPTQLTPPTYDYAAPETCAGCHYISAAELGPESALDHTSRVLGVWLQNAAAVDNSCTATGVPYTCCTGAHAGTCPDMWQLTGSGWFASRHSQSDYASTENAFCAKCHSPLQASASASFNNGAVVNAGPVPQQRFQAVTCATCHPPDNITAQIGALNPDAIDGGAISIYLFKGYNNPASYQTLSTGVNADGTSKEDLLCLNCHEQRHNFTPGTPMYAMMTTTHNHLIPGGGPVRCMDCHMSTYQSIGGGSTGLPVLEERFHDWNVGADLPYSCGAIGSVSNCHNGRFSKFTVTDAQNLIPYIKEQHSDWWSLPPFNGEVQVAMSAHAAPTLVEFKILEREISKIDAM
jgi:NapC/NirT cytochrome c family, N-terminal region